MSKTKTNSSKKNKSFFVSSTDETTKTQTDEATTKTQTNEATTKTQLNDAKVSNSDTHEDSESQISPTDDSDSDCNDEPVKESKTAKQEEVQSKKSIRNSKQTGQYEMPKDKDNNAPTNVQQRSQSVLDFSYDDILNDVASGSLNLGTASHEIRLKWFVAITHREGKFGHCGKLKKMLLEMSGELVHTPQQFDNYRGNYRGGYRGGSYRGNYRGRSTLQSYHRSGRGVDNE